MFSAEAKRCRILQDRIHKVGGYTAAELQVKYDKAKAALDAIGPEPNKPSPEKRFFGSKGREGHKPEVVAAYDAKAKAYRSWRAKYSKLKKAEVDASNELFHAKQAQPTAAGSRGSRARPTKAKAETPAKAVKKVKAAAKATPRDAGEIKAEIVQRIQEELDKVSADGGLTIKQSEYDPNDYHFENADGEQVGNRVAIVETAPGKFTGTYRVGSRLAEKVTGDSQEAVIAKLKAIYSEAKGKVTFQIPGDGTFTLTRNGKSLYDLLQRAKQIDVKTTPLKTPPVKTKAGPYRLIRRGYLCDATRDDVRQRRRHSRSGSAA